MTEGRSRMVALFAAIAVVLVVALAAVALDGDDPAGDDDRAGGGAVAEGEGTDEGLDRQRDWLVDLVNGTVEPADEDLAQHFASSFLAAVPPTEVRTTFTALQAQAPWTLLEEVERRDGVLAAQLVGAGDVQARLTVGLDPAGRIETTTILMAGECAGLVDPETVTMAPRLRERFDWVMELLGSTRTPSDDELRGQLHGSFLDQVPPEAFRQQTQSIRSLGPFRVRWFEGAPTDGSLQARLGLHSGEEARLSLTVEGSEPHRITGLTVLTQPPCALDV